MQVLKPISILKNKLNNLKEHLVKQIIQDCKIN